MGVVESSLLCMVRWSAEEIVQDRIVIVGQFPSSTSSTIAWPVKRRYRYDQDMPTARIKASTTSAIHVIACLSASVTQPQETTNQMSAANSANASTIPSTPMARSVALRNTTHAISSTIPQTASTGVTCGKPFDTMCTYE